MESVPGAVATGLTLARSTGSDLRLYPVATAPGTDLIPQTKTLPEVALGQLHSIVDIIIVDIIS